MTVDLSKKRSRRGKCCDYLKKILKLLIILLRKVVDPNCIILISRSNNIVKLDRLCE